MLLYKILAFVKKDFLTTSTYKLAFILGIIESLLPVLLLFYLSKFIGNSSTLLTEYGGNYFSYAIVGLSFTFFFRNATNTFTSNISNAQVTGCFEAIFSSKTSETSLILLSPVYSFIYSGSVLLLTLFVAFGIGVEKVDLNLPAFGLSLVLSVIMFVSFGIIIASGTILYKKGNILGAFFGEGSAFIAGAYFPIAIFPEWVQKISQILPLTYSLRALRLSLLNGYSIEMLSTELLVVASISLAFFSLSIFTFKRAVHLGKKKGILANY
jgi:ABC-2 type transport system permease protein